MRSRFWVEQSQKKKEKSFDVQVIEVSWKLLESEIDIDSGKGID